MQSLKSFGCLCLLMTLLTACGTEYFGPQNNRRLGASIRDVILKDAPFLYWRLNDSGTTAVDSSGNSRHGTYYGSPTLGALSLMSQDTDPAVTLDGATQRVRSGATIYSDNNTGLTIEAWIKHRYKATQANVVSIGQDVTTQIHYLGADNLSGFHYAYKVAAGGALFVTGVYPTDGTRYHIVLTHDYVTLAVKLFINGSLVIDGNEGSLSLVKTTNKAIEVGSYNNGANYFYKGTIDDVVIYSYALTSDQVIAHYNASTN